MRNSKDCDDVLVSSKVREMRDDAKIHMKVCSFLSFLSFFCLSIFLPYFLLRYQCFHFPFIQYIIPFFFGCVGGRQSLQSTYKERVKMIEGEKVGSYSANDKIILAFR